MEKLAKAALTFLIVVIVCLPAYWVNNIIVYEEQDYEISVIRSHLQLALDTHNIDAKVSYIDDTVKSLDAYSGNGNWWFPKDNTDIDETRELLRTVSQDVGEQGDVKERDGYFVLPHNELITYLNSEIDRGDHRLRDYGAAIHFSPYNNIGHWVIIPLALLSIISMFICLIRLD